MFKINNINPSTSLQSVEVMQGETIEEKVERIVNNKDPIIVTGKQIGRASCRERVSSPV